MTLAEVGKRIGLRGQSVHDYLSGKSRIPHDKLGQLLSVYDCTLTQLERELQGNQQEASRGDALGSLLALSDSQVTDPGEAAVLRDPAMSFIWRHLKALAGKVEQLESQDRGSTQEEAGAGAAKA